MDDEYEAPPEVLLLMCYAYVAEGLFLVIGLLGLNLKNFSSRVGPHDNEQQLFSLNFFALLEGGGYQSEAPYNEFKKDASESRFSDNFLRDQGEIFEKAQKTVEQLKCKFSIDTGRLAELHRLEDVAVTNKETFNYLCRVVGFELLSDIDIDFSMHPHFVAVLCRAL